MPKEPKEEKAILLVEGKDDKHVLSNLMNHHKIPETFVIKDKGGYTNIIDTLDVEIDRSGLERLGIIVDADTSVTTRWESFAKRFIAMGYTHTPDKPSPAGTIIEQPGRPTLGLWIMPNNQLPGMLEDFIGFLVPHYEHNVLWQYAQTCLSQLPLPTALPEYEQRFAPHHSAKARIHTWLAWQPEPGSPLGLAITKKYLTADANQILPFISWLQRLYATSA